LKYPRLNETIPETKGKNGNGVLSACVKGI